MNIKKLFVVISSSLLPFCASAATVASINCEDPNATKAFAAGFNAQAKAEIDKGKAQEKLNQQNFEAMKDRVVAAGVWSEAEANAYLNSLVAKSPDLRELEDVRVKAAKELKTLQYALAGVPMIAAGDVQAENRAVCILGQKAMNQLSIMNGAAASAWEIVNLRIAEFGKEKGVNGF